MDAAMRIDAKGMHYKELNETIHKAVSDGHTRIVLENVNGQRYIAAGLAGNIRIKINGIPGNDMAAFMDGPILEVSENAQDGTGNTMNSGKIIISGNAGDIIGHSMRGGKIFIKGDVGYRVGIHMKAYQELYPVIIAGGCAQDFLGEYMAGGLIIILGLNSEENVPIVGNFCGTGMHGGIIYIRGRVEDFQLGKEVKVFDLNEKDMENLKNYLREYSADFSLDMEGILKRPFCKLIPYTHRPYGKLYAY
ncbi:hypothetical protein JXL19_00625 [bacterium]|nr:hypothetical protein [bacterium]